jgi:hypothetical protein
MRELRGKHSRYGVKRYMYPAMREALVFTVDNIYFYDVISTKIELAEEESRLPSSP